MVADEEQVGLYAFKVWSYKQGEVVSLMVHLGDRLGLYRSLAEGGPATAGGLAERTGLNERWLLEWLRGQAAAGLVNSTDGETFVLPDEAAPVLADSESSVWFAAGAFQGGVVPSDVVDRLAESFQTGVGLTYDDLGPGAAHGVERMLGPWTRHALVPMILPALDGAVERLQAGCRVVDIGCGAGVALLAMAHAFPQSQFDGFDPSRHAIDRARARLDETGLSNVRLYDRAASELPDASTYDLVLTLDCLHDMPHPQEATAAIRRAITDEGTWLIKEIRAGTSWAENLKNPMLALMYGTSVATCMSSALSEPGGAGLGTLGLDRVRLEDMCRAEGFTRFRMHDFDDPANLYYEVRP